jgi:hypothetical protein
MSPTLARAHAAPHPRHARPLEGALFDGVG